MDVLIWLVPFLLPILVSSATLQECDRCAHNSTAAILYNKDNNYRNGACQYGGDTIEFNGAHPVGVVESIYLKGSGCGASYQVRCKNKTMCKPGGIKVIVTSDGKYNGKASFVLSNETFFELFVEKYRAYVRKLKLKSIDVEHKRIPSVYGEDQPMKIQIENMNDENNFAMKLLYQGGQTYVLSIDVMFRHPYEWIPMKRKVGAVWEVAKNVPEGWDLRFRFKVLEGYRKTHRYSTSFVKILKKNGVYGLGRQLDGKISKEQCYKCDDKTWI